MDAWEMAMQQIRELKEENERLRKTLRRCRHLVDFFNEWGYGLENIKHAVDEALAASE